MMKIDEFTLYFLARLTKVQRVIDLNNRNNVIIDIPANYKDIIEDILNSNESWKEEFSVLIDMDEYFKDHYAWEKKFAISLEKTLTILGKRVDYDFQSDTMRVTFSKMEVQALLDETDNKDLNNIMDHFVSLIQDCQYTRDYREFMDKFDDNNRKIRKMLGYE